MLLTASHEHALFVGKLEKKSLILTELNFDCSKHLLAQGWKWLLVVEPFLYGVVIELAVAPTLRSFRLQELPSDSPFVVQELVMPTRRSRHLMSYDLHCLGLILRDAVGMDLAR